MKFYSIQTRKPESIIEVVMDGLKEVSRKRICQFHDGICEVSDEKVIAKLKKHPERFRTDRPWPTNNWQDTAEGKKLIAKGIALKIDTRHIRKEYLMKLIAEADKDVSGEVTKVIEPVQRPFQDILDEAKSLGIPTHRRKKDDILEDIKNMGTKEVIINARS